MRRRTTSYATLSRRSDTRHESGRIQLALALLEQAVLWVIVADDWG